MTEAYFNEVLRDNKSRMRLRKGAEMSENEKTILDYWHDMKEAHRGMMSAAVSRGKTFGILVADDRDAKSYQLWDQQREECEKAIFDFLEKHG